MIVPSLLLSLPTSGVLGADAPPPAPADATPSPNPPAPETAPDPAEPPTTGPGEEPSEIWEWTARGIRAASLSGDTIGTAIFDLIEDLKLFKVDVGEGQARVRTGRRIYDNHDVLGSYTVVDRFRVSLNYPLYTWSEAINGTFTSTFAVGSHHELDFVHIRQVLPSAFAELPRTPQAPSDLFTPGWSQNADSSDPAQAPGWDRMQPTVATIDRPQAEDAFDALGRARWSSLWNLLVVPFRVPTKPEWIERIAPGDIVSWRGSGTIEVGPGIGLSLKVPGALRIYDASLQYRIFVAGNFSISVLREDQDHVRLKVTRTASFGDRWSFGGGSSGVISDLALQSWNPIERLTRMSPMAVGRSRSMSTGFDVVFRYDLRDPAAREAYRHAVFGNLVASDQLAGGDAWREHPEPAAVRRIGDQSRKSRNTTLGTSTRYGSFYRHNHDAAVEHTDLIVDIGDGPVRVLRSQAKNTTRWRWFWGAQERVETDVTVWADRDRLDAGEDDAVTLTVTHEVVDSLTSGPELLTYIDLMETATGRRGFFPRPPAYLPEEPRDRSHGHIDFDRRRHRDVIVKHPIRLGRSSFYAQVTYSQDQIQRFLAIPQEERWSAMETAFGVTAGAWSSRSRRALYGTSNALKTLLNIPLYPFNQHLPQGSHLFSAQSAVRSWRNADRSQDLHRQLCLLVEMFASRRYGFELTHLLRLRLGDEPVSYAVKGSSYVFGTMRDEGQGVAPLSPLPERMSERIDFDTPQARRTPVVQATIANLTLEPIDHDRLRVKLTIAADARPTALYARLIERRPWSLSRSIGAAVVAHLDQPLQAGVNEWILDRRAGPMSDLLGRTEHGLEYEFVVAISLDGRTWGPITSSPFTMPLPPSGTRDVLRPRLMDR